MVRDGAYSSSPALCMVFRLWTTEGRSTAFNGNSITRRPGTPRIRTVRPHLVRTSSLPDPATCPLPNCPTALRSLRPRSPFLSPLAPSLRRLSTLVAWPAWRFWSSRGGLPPREGGREGRKLLETFPAADEGSQQQPCRRRRRRR